MRCYSKKFFSQGDVARNKDAVGLAVEKLGMRPSQGMLEQAVYQFLSLCLPRSVEVCSTLLVFKVLCDINELVGHEHAYQAACM